MPEPERPPRPGERRQARTLRPMSHAERSFPSSKMYHPGSTITVIWTDGWQMRDGTRGLGKGEPGRDFEFV